MGIRGGVHGYTWGFSGVCTRFDFSGVSRTRILVPGFWFPDYDSRITIPGFNIPGFNNQAAFNGDSAVLLTLAVLLTAYALIDGLTLLMLYI